MIRILLILFFFLCFSNSKSQIVVLKSEYEAKWGVVSEEQLQVPSSIVVNRNIVVDDYFPFMDSLTVKYDSVLNYPFTEHLLVRANPWIIDTLANTDYYRMTKRDSFVYDQGKMITLKKGDSLKIPDSISAGRILRDFENTYVDINIPEYKLRIIQDSVEIFSFPIRVGQNKKRYLTMGDRTTDLRTKTGIGKIVRHARNPDFYNPVNGKQFFLTKRDDEKTTLMPQIPWIETEINGVRNGQMIHPTTNPKSLGKAYSNGCIGTREADGWIIYYYTPIGTPIHIRYDLIVKDLEGVELLLEDIYNLNN